MSEITRPSSGTQQTHHVYYVAFLLRQKLIPDLVSDIMDQAEIYWTTEKQTSWHKQVIVSQSTAPREILRSDAVASPTRMQHPVRKIVFTISSHDQGWAARRDQGSWTWFTARKVPPEDDTSLGVSDRATSEQGTQGRRVLCRNLVAQRQRNLHEITWRVDSDDLEEAEWISSLKVGDTIAVDAWAKFSGWINKIQQASITIHTMAIA